MAQVQVQDFCRRLRVPAAVGSQAMEYYRLSELKCARGSISSPCMALICIELAASQLRETFDKKQAQKLSGLRPAAYLNSYQTLEKLLDLTSHLGPRQLAVRLGCLAAVARAEEILQGYREMVKEKYSEVQREGLLDTDKPLHTAAALYCACKSMKMRCDKSKFLSSSMSTKILFQNVLDEMVKCVPKNTDTPKAKRRKLNQGEEEEEEGESMEVVKEVSVSVPRPKRESLLSRILSDPTSSQYQEWKERTIKQARLELS